MYDRLSCLPLPVNHTHGSIKFGNTAYQGACMQKLAWMHAVLRLSISVMVTGRCLDHECIITLLAASHRLKCAMLAGRPG